MNKAVGSGAEEVTGLGESPPKIAARRRKLSKNIRLSISVLRRFEPKILRGVDRGILGHVRRMIKVFWVDVRLGL